MDACILSEHTFHFLTGFLFPKKGGGGERNMNVEQGNTIRKTFFTQECVHISYMKPTTHEIEF